MHPWRTGALSVERLTIPIAGLPHALQGLVIVQLSDFHEDGQRLSAQLLASTIATVNQIQPDLIVLTGDYVTDDPSPIEHLAQALQQLNSRAGVYAILGNHDLCYSHSRDQITKALTSAKIHVLWDQIVFPLGKDLAFVGLRDYWSPRFRPAPIMNQLAPDLPRIVLAHNPDSAYSLSRWRVDLQLSGHTHGGQIVLPGIGPVVAKVKLLRQRLPKSWRRLLNPCGDRTVQHWEWAQGLHHVGENLLYVNRGLGTYWPGRLFCPPEITVFTLIQKNNS
jgi:predicted MPP superfamily phosphohydrolase